MELSIEKNHVVNVSEFTKRCYKCLGIGLMKTMKFKKNCLCETTEFCYKCENTNKYGMYKECETCWGTGAVLNKINANYR